MTKKKKILALEQQVKMLENRMEKINKTTLVATGTVAATSVGAVILSLVVKKKSANDINELVDNVNKLINVISTSNVISVGDDAAVVDDEEDNEDDDSSKQSRVQITGSFSGPEFKSQINALAEFLSNINFEDGYKFNARALKDVVLSFIPEIRDDEMSIVHISPSFLSDSEICGKDGLHFFIYVPKCKIKVRIDEEGVTIKDVTKY